MLWSVPAAAGLLVVLAAGCGPGGAEATGPDLVDVRELEPSIRTDIRYAGPENFVGAPVDGYEAP